MLKSIRRWAGIIKHSEKSISAYNILSSKREEKNHLEELEADERIILK
jgi:hypothetical protein